MEARDTANEIKHHLKQKEIIEWLFRSDPLTNFRRASGKRQRGTGQWLLDSAEFQSWNESSNCFLWLYGRPGCGKTILSSTIIKDLVWRSKTSSNYTVLYYYFDFNDASKRSLENLMRSIVIQLGEKNDCARQKLAEMYEAKGGSFTPSVDWLVDTFHQMTCVSNDVKIVLDALDEVEKEERRDLMKWVKKTVRMPSGNTCIIATSRRELDIEKGLRDGKTITVDLYREAVNDDIKAFVHSSIRDSERCPDLERWRLHPNVQKEIETALAEKADGM